MANGCDMIVGLTHLPTYEIPEGVEIKRAYVGDRQKILQFVRKKFPAHVVWPDETDYALMQEGCKCFIAAENGKLLGFACYDASALGFFGPIGIRADRRGENIGAALLVRTLTAMHEQGYDVAEVCTKFINNYIKQFAEDRFFHADPHPGNVRVWDGRIVWLDLGMMGRMTEKDAKLIKSCMRAIVSNDHKVFADNVLDICDHDPEINMQDYYERMRVYLDKYRIISMEQMSSTVDIFADLYRIARDFGIKVPKTLTMFWRSLSIMEGTVSELAPETDLAAIIGKHLAAQAMIGGIAGAITKSVSHRKLISGNELSYNGHIREPDEEIEDSE